MINRKPWFRRIVLQLTALTLLGCGACPLWGQPFRPGAGPGTPMLPPPPLPAPVAPAQPTPADQTPQPNLDAPGREADRTPGYLGLVADTATNGVIGAEVLSIAEGGPAAMALFAVGDTIQRCNGQAIRSVQDLAGVLNPLGVGQAATFEVRRGNQLVELKVTLGTRPASPPAGASPPSSTPPTSPPAAPLGMPMLGVRAAPLDVITASRLGLPIRGGALVESVVASSPAAMAGIAPGCIIVRLNDTAILSPEDLRNAVVGHRVGELVQLQYYLGTRLASKLIRLTAAPLDSSTPLLRPRLPETQPIAPRTDADAAQRAQTMHEINELRREMMRLQERIRQLERSLQP